jgi:hypothetical protein
MKLYDYDVKDDDDKTLTPEQISDLILAQREYRPSRFWYSAVESNHARRLHKPLLYR